MSANDPKRTCGPHIGLTGWRLMRSGGILVGMRGKSATAGWLVSVQPVLHGSEPIHFAAAFRTDAEAKHAIQESPEGRGNRVTVLRALNVIEMMHLDMKAGEIKRHG